MGPDVMQPRVLRELAGFIMRLLSIIFERAWRSGKIPSDRRKANVAPVFRKDKKDDPGNYRLVSLTSIPGKIMEQALLGHISGNMKEEVIGKSQHRFIKSKTCLNNLMPSMMR